MLNFPTGKLLNYLKSISDSGIEFIDYPALKRQKTVFVANVKFNYQGRGICTWGASYERDLAAIKAMAEAFERLISLDYFPLFFKKNFGFQSEVSLNTLWPLSGPTSFSRFTSSNGFAVHNSTQGARKNSKLEIIERHSLLAMSVSGSPPRQILPSPEIRSILLEEDLSSHINFYSIEVIKGFPTVVAELRSNLNRFLRFGCGHSHELALQKAFLELVPTLAIKDTYKPNDKPDFSTPVGINDYYCVNHDTSFDQLLSLPSEGTSTALPTTCPPIYYSSLKECLHLRAFPYLKASFAISPFLQPLFWGPWNMKKINPRALQPKTFPTGPHIVC